MSISLLPEEVKEKRVEERRLGVLKKTGFAFFALSAILALGSFWYFQSLGRSLSRIDQEITSSQQKIESLQEVAAIVFDVESRSAKLQSIFNEEIYFSRLLESLSTAQSADVSLLELSAPSSSQANLSGSARSYSSLAKFLLALKQDTTPDSLFTKVELREVSLDQQTGLARFSVILGIREGALGNNE